MCSALVVSVCSTINFFFLKSLFQYLHVIIGLLFCSWFFLLFHFCSVCVLLFQKNMVLDTLALFRTLEIRISLTNVTQLMLIDTNVS